MTVEDDSAPMESVPDQRPKRRRSARPKAFGNAIGGAFLALAVLFALGVVATYFMRDRTATSAGPQTVTVTPSAKGAADSRFFSSLAIYGISDNGNEAVRQRFMEFGHHTCFSLLPPKPQTFDSTVSGIMTAENQDVASGSPWSPQFTRDDAEHLAQAAIGAYCPNAKK